MATSFYDFSVACFLQTVEGVSGFLERGADHYAEQGIDVNELVETRLYPDMFPFRFQVLQVAHHSLGAIEAIKKGVFSPAIEPSGLDYRGLQTLVADALAGLKAVSREEIDALEGRDVRFEFRDHTMPFTAEGFVLSFSLPNLHFHATTAYDILRLKGVPVGKRDYLGPLRLKV